MPPVASANKKTPSAARRVPLKAPPVFARILPKNVGGHLDDGETVYKRLKGWTEGRTRDDDDNGADASVTLEDGHGDTRYDFPTLVFGPDASQETLYSEVAAPLASRFWDASNPQSVFLFAYGQTGTGKTHTLMGPEESWNTVRHPQWGIFPRVVDATLTEMRSRDATEAYSLHVSAVEFYFCTCFDLLDDHKLCLVEAGEPIGRRQVEVRSAEDVLALMAVVREKRTTRVTKMNPGTSKGGSNTSQSQSHGGSSRSHCALTLTLRRFSRSSSVEGGGGGGGEGGRGGKGKDIKGGGGGGGGALVTTFTCMDLAGAERPSSNGEDHASAMNAIMTYWRDPNKVRVGEQGVIINYELASLRSAVVQAAEAHGKGRKVAPPTQLGTAAVNYMTSAFDGMMAVSTVVTLSQAPKCGWETWFACTYAEDVAKLRMPSSGRDERATEAGKALWTRSAMMAASTKAALDRTPPSGHPSSKYHARRTVEARHWAQEAKIASELKAKLGGGAQ